MSESESRIEMADVGRGAGNQSAQAPTTPRSLITGTGRSFAEAPSWKFKICVRGVENLPLIVNPATNRSEPCDACALIKVGSQVVKTAVINGALSARWEHDCQVNVGGEEGEDLEVHLLHCDRVAADKHLGFALIKLADFIKQYSSRTLSANRAIERTVPVLTREGEVLRGQDGNKTILTLSFTLLDGASPIPSDSDDDTSLPKSHIKSAQYKMLAESREASFRSLQAGEASDVKMNGSQSRGGVGLKFKVLNRPLPTLIPPRIRDPLESPFASASRAARPPASCNPNIAHLRQIYRVGCGLALALHPRIRTLRNAASDQFRGRRPHPASRQPPCRYAAPRPPFSARQSAPPPRGGGGGDGGARRCKGGS